MSTSYKKTLGLSASTGTPGYQYTFDWTDSGEIAHANSDFSDVVVTDLNGDLVPFCIDFYTASTSARISCMFPNGATSLVMHYGDGNIETSIGDGYQTFPILYEDWTNGIDTNKWTVVENANGSCTVTDNVLRVVTTAGSNYVRTTTAYGTRPQRLDMRLKFTYTANPRNRFRPFSLGSGHDLGLFYSSGFKYFFATGYTSVTNTSGTWTDQIFTRTGDLSYTWTNTDGLSVGNNMYSKYWGMQPIIAVGDTTTYTGDIYCDYLRIREYMSSPPTLTVGSEQSESGKSINRYSDIRDYELLHDKLYLGGVR